MLKRLHGREDAGFLREAWKWDEDRPRWYREMDSVFSTGSIDDLISQLSDWRKCFIGVFNPDLIAIIIIDWADDGLFEGHLMARRGADLDLLASTITHLARDLIQFGMREVCVWVAEKNLPVRRLCECAKIKPDGVVMFRGAYRGRVIRWLRHSLTREDLNAKAHFKDKPEQSVPEHGHLLSDSSRVERVHQSLR